jgi:hypothetical protein
MQAKVPIEETQGFFVGGEADEASIEYSSTCAKRLL